MAHAPIPSSPMRKARLAGALYLVVILTGMFAEAFVRERLVVPGNAAATARAILAHETLFRFGFTAQVLTVLSNLPLAILLYDLFRVVDRNLARLMVAFILVATAVETASLVNHFAPLTLLESTRSLGAFPPEQVQALAYASLRAQPIGFALSLVFFGFDILVTGWLCLKSTFLPRTIGILMGLAGVCYVANSFLIFLAPAVHGRMFPFILMPCLVGEGAFTLWLLLKGVDAAAWEAQRRGEG